MSSGMIIDGIAASEAIDSSGEILDIKGCDISDLENGLGVLNWEHRGDDAQGASANDIIGKIAFAKKIFGPEDCTDNRQLEYWQKIQLPYIYIIARLFDGSGHPGAIAAAAMIRDYQKNGEPLLIRYSIEGTTLKKDKSSNRLLESVARRVAATIKPCNKSCHSGLISDPNDSTVKKGEQEFPHPNFTPLGGSFDYEAGIVDNERIEKALSAGSYNAAPGTLVGGSALQREDRGLTNRVKAAVRDWDRKTPFKKFLKHRLPEASDDFIDRFSGLVQDYTIRKAQRQVLKDTLVKKAIEKVKAKQAAPAPEPEATGKLTIRGAPVEPNPTMARVAFDEKKGVLHTPRGSFPMYIPSRDKDVPDAGQKFHNIMADKKIEKFHDYAMENWTKLHQHLKAGTLPPEVVMHGVLFSQLSPNTPVPMQELMYSHLVDSMKATGHDPRSPEGLDELKRDWLERDQPQKWPEHSREHFKRLEGQLRLKMDSKGTERRKGDVSSFMLANVKFKNMSKYHQLHDNLVNLVGRHRHNARAAVEELMFHKKQAALWDAKRKRHADKGAGDIGEYTAGPNVPGLAPKTARYTYGMLGGGNVTVPDTHFARYLFGLDRDKDADTVKYLRNQVLWNENNSHILGAIDRYYGKHHDAVKHMLAHPKWKQHFESPEDAIFPAFWKNWTGILPHEAARGMKTYGWNESTDHRPFWDAVSPHLHKAEAEQPSSLPERTAHTHREWVEKYGEMPALLMYYRYLVPQLLAEAEKRQPKPSPVQKFESLIIDFQALLKDDQPDLFPEIESVKLPKAPKHFSFNGKSVKPGVAHVFGSNDGDSQRYAILDHAPDHFMAVPEAKLHNWSPQDLLKLPRQDESKSYSVSKMPEHIEAEPLIDADKHGVADYVHHDDTRAMVHGLDLSKRKSKSKVGSLRQHLSFWIKGPNGKRLFVKQDPDEGHFMDARREALYHNLARDFFGLGEYVQPTTVVRHPKTGAEMAVIEGIPKGEHYENADHERILDDLDAKGETHKLAMMNMIGDNTDRHGMNFMFTPDGKLKLIDHGYTYGGHDYRIPTPSYLRGSDDYVHPEAAKWAHSLKADELEAQMYRHGVPENVIQDSKRRLKRLQSHLRQNPKSSIIEALRAPFERY